MKALSVAAASAIFFAAVIVELTSRLWPGSYLALLLVATVGLLINGLLNSRLALTGAPVQRGSRKEAATPSSPPPSTRRRSRDRGSSSTASGPREEGTVKWFNRNKGFGFIIRESGDEIFVHQRSIRSVGEGANQRRPTLRDGQPVSFQVAERDKGTQAEDVVPRD